MRPVLLRELRERLLGLIHLMNSATTGAVLGAPLKTKVWLVLLVWRHALLARWMVLGP